MMDESNLLLMSVDGMENIEIINCQFFNNNRSSNIFDNNTNNIPYQNEEYIDKLITINNTNKVIIKNNTF